MKKFLVILAAGMMTATPALAETLVHDGVTYVYSVKQRGAFQIIRGEDVTNRRAFELKVGRTWIDGIVDGRSVAFRKSEVRPISPTVLVAEVAKR